MKEFDVTVVYYGINAETEDGAREQIQPLLDGFYAEIESIEEIE